jgi:hypothetical protein
MQRALIFVASIAFTGCGDELMLGYVNKLHQPVTIVERGWDVGNPRQLKPGAVSPPSFGHMPSTIEIATADGKIIAHRRVSEIPRVGPRGGIRYVVISDADIVMELKNHFEYERTQPTQP